MLVTGAPTGDSFPVTRAQESTSAAEHAAGVECFDSITQARWQELTDLDQVHAASAKSPLVDNDEVLVKDSADSYTSKKALWSVVKSTLKTYFDTLYAAAGSYLSNIADDTTPELGGNLTVGAHSLHLDEALSSDHTYSGVTFDGTAGEQIDASQSFGKLCYKKFSDGKWYLADKDAESTASGSLGICVSTGAKTTDDALLLAGPGTYVRDDTWSFDEDVQFVGDSGALADGTASDAYTSGDQIRVVGRAYTSGILHFQPSPNWGAI